MIFVVIYKVFPYKIGEPGSVLSCGWYMLLCVAFYMVRLYVAAPCTVACCRFIASQCEKVGL